ncbi:MAG: 2-iminoacetate synthase ThiH [Syntrophobacteraceae bacterium]
MSFFEEAKRYHRDDIARDIGNRSQADVERALTAGTLTLDGLMSLLSTAAEPFIEEMAQRAHRITEQRFGRIMSLFAPIYLSNECTNSCVYCGFNRNNTVERLTLSADQAAAEGKYLNNLGFRHLLLVSGEAPHIVTMEYLKKIIETLRPLFSSMAVEIFPMSAEAYRKLGDWGIDGLVVYQETYNEELYQKVHPSGPKRNFRWRMETPDRGGEAGFRRIGIGTLLGLDNWRIEAFYLALHARYLMRKYWKSHITISFPRLRPAAGGYEPPYPVSDLHLVQLLTALRLFLPDAGLILSTRESPHLRDHLIPLGITSMSAGSRTDPGGYTHEVEAEAQFEIADERSPRAIADLIKQSGYEPVWKDWDGEFLR